MTEAADHSPVVVPETAREATWLRFLHRSEIVLMVGALAAMAMHHGRYATSPGWNWTIGGLAVGSLAASVAYVAWSWWESVTRRAYLREHGLRVALLGGWIVGLPISPFLASAAWPETFGAPGAGPFAWSELVLVSHGLLRAVRAIRRILAHGWNPAIVFVGSFALLIGLGALLLMLPRCRAGENFPGDLGGAPWDTALFTSTSACCVTGLVVQPTGLYWSRTGHVVILALIQLGGLGVMTWGSFFAVFAASGMGLRESASLRDMWDAEQLGNVRGLLRAIVGFTLLSELAGAALLSGLWAHLPWGERIFQSVFHSVSAFCNAGFALTDDGALGPEVVAAGGSFNGLGAHWEVWGVLSLLIVVGGLGFGVLHDLFGAAATWWRGGRPMLSPLIPRSTIRWRTALTSRLVLVSTAALLVGGAAAFFFFEEDGTGRDVPLAGRAADAWFQSVVFRTAGFSSVDHARLEPASKLTAIALMFVGASPGSTGGGVKTVTFALTLMTISSHLRGRDRLEAFGRTVPLSQATRALTIVALGLAVVLACTLLLAIFEDAPGRFLDHLFEAVSAFGTVGASCALTPTLTLPSRLAVVATMFLGRVGPLTLLLALAGTARESRYEYPVERVVLG